MVRDGFLIIVAGPGNEEGGEDLGEREGRVWPTTKNLLETWNIEYQGYGLQITYLKL